MTHAALRLCSLVILLEPIGSGSGNPLSCSEPPEFAGLTIGQVRARLAAGQSDFFLYKNLEDLTPAIPKPGTLSDEFQLLLRAHPNDSGHMYLYGRSLVEKDTPEAIAELNRAVASEPGMPWTYMALADIYASRNFSDRGKLLADMETYRRLCPQNLDGFKYLNLVTDQAETEEWATQLRGLLKKTPGGDDGQYWRTLWSAEFRAAPLAKYDVLRKRVAKDVQVLESRPQPWSRDLLFVLDDGYELTGRRKKADEIDRQIDPDQEAAVAIGQWEKNSGVLRPQVDRDPYMREYAKLAEEWVAKWPRSALAWNTRLLSITFDPKWTKGEMEQAGEALLKAGAARPLYWTFAPIELDVARIWVRNGIRPKECVALAEDALHEISLGPEIAGDLNAGPNAAQNAARRLFGFNNHLWIAMSVIVDGSLQVHDLDKARAMRERMSQWVIANQALSDDRTSGFVRFRGEWLNSGGEIAEAEGRKPDAIAFYAKAIAGGYREADMTKHALALWAELGGTREGWGFLTARAPTPKPAAVIPKPADDDVSAFAAWKPVGKTLPEINLRDLSGKSWTLQIFEGKTTFVNVWARWCKPCIEELPQIERLYALTKDRPDIQLITLNVDDDPGLVQPFMTANHYSFPVLISPLSYVEGVTGPLSIPQNWLVDSKYILKQESIGFDSSLSDWPGKMLEKLSAISH